MSEDLTDRKVILANGDSVPLRAASLNYGRLQAAIEIADGEWEPLHLLRRVCLGEDLDREQRVDLVRQRLLTEDGSVDPCMKSVVLSSVRGQDHQLFLDCPFTSAFDRALSEYLNSRDYVRAHAPDKQSAEAFLAHDPLERALEAFRKPLTPEEEKNLTETARDARARFAERIRKELGSEGGIDDKDNEQDPQPKGPQR